MTDAIEDLIRATEEKAHWVASASVSKARAELAALREENKKLRESNESWQSSRIIWHQCESAVRAYPSVLCSMCQRPSSEKDFDALERFESLREKRDGLREALEKIVRLGDGIQYAEDFPGFGSNGVIEIAEAALGQKDVTKGAF